MSVAALRALMVLRKKPVDQCPGLGARGKNASGMRWMCPNSLARSATTTSAPMRVPR